MGTIPLWLLIYEAGEPNSQNFAVPYDQLGKFCIIDQLVFHKGSR